MIVDSFIDEVKKDPQADWDTLESFIKELECQPNSDKEVKRRYFKKRIMVW